MTDVGIIPQEEQPVMADSYPSRTILHYRFTCYDHVAVFNFGVMTLCAEFIEGCQLAVVVLVWRLQKYLIISTMAEFVLMIKCIASF